MKITEEGRVALRGDVLWRGNARDLRVLRAVSEGRDAYALKYPRNKVLSSLNFLKEVGYIK